MRGDFPMQALWQGLYALSALTALSALGEVMLPDGRLKESVRFIAGIAVLSTMLNGLMGLMG